MDRAYYSERVSAFIQTPEKEILGQLVANHGFSDEIEQRNAWIEQIRLLQKNLKEFPDATIFFEFKIPRMGKRADNILILNGIVYVLEFKVHARTYESQAEDQVVDYAVDLKNFHLGSHHKMLVPMLIATDAPEQENRFILPEDKVLELIRANGKNFSEIIKSIDRLYREAAFDVEKWASSMYHPTPTIIEAAQTLYSSHTVADISRHGADEINLSLTKDAVKEIIRESKEKQQKSICFITGVPGAGKTLAGLDIATSSMNQEADEHTCFLSGNGPLVKVLREALIRNKAQADRVSRKKVEPAVCAFIQNIHHFRDEYYKNPGPPAERVVIFDEAQRAWDREQTSKFMNKRDPAGNFSSSEPEFLIGVMDRIDGWGVIVCLIGGGQEINTGEAGLYEWFRALKEKYPHWKSHVSPEILTQSDFSGGDISRLAEKMDLSRKRALHLSVSLRSFKSASLSEFVRKLIDNRPDEARAIFKTLSERYPIVMTRDLNQAKAWVREKARGSERIGLLAHSNALRLKPEGIFVKSEIKCEDYFLNPKGDVRSSYVLEDCATEFDVQGLELDWAVVAWDINLRYRKGWDCFRFKGSRWQNMKADADRKYLLNSYRVLLTRARQGMVLFVPRGSGRDRTRPPELYDSVCRYLMECGIPDYGSSAFRHDFKNISA